MQIKRMFVAAAVVAMVSSGAMAASLVRIEPLDGATSSQGRAITPDGKYVAGISGTRGFFWSPDAGTVNVIHGGRQSTEASGIGYRVVQAGTEIVIAGESAGFHTSFGAADPGAGTPTMLWSARETSGWPGGHNPVNPTANALGGTGTVHWYVTFDHGTSATAMRRIWLARGYGDPTGLLTGSYGDKNNPVETHVRGISNTGRAVAGRRDGSSANGAAGYRNTYYDYIGATTPTQTIFKGLRAGTQDGEAWAVSDDGMFIGGMSGVDDRFGQWPYLYDVANDTIVELPTFDNSDQGRSLNGIVYDVSADGRYAVGLDFTRGMELAVLWDTCTGTEIDLTQFAADNGILGDFTLNLRRAYSVGVNADGAPVVTGWGVDTNVAVIGFVMTLPSPIVKTALDIRPNDCSTNFTVNKNSKGRIPMAILGSADLDVTTIDVDSISINGVAFPVKTPSVQDVTQPGATVCDCGAGPDGYPDLILHFAQHDLIDALGLDALAEDTVVEVTVKADLPNCRTVEATGCITVHQPGPGE